ncbi:MAG: DUF1572 family protein [Mariniblastus sp.]|nr:DUF1572 family protein [Mariniblastus sp.]
MNDTNSLLAREYTSESVHLLEQSMLKIEHCLSQLNEKQVWWRSQPSTNSVGNLLLHLAGNLQQWAVSGVGKLPDDRDRASEFAVEEGIEKEKLFKSLRSVVTKASSTIQSQSEQDLLGKISIQGFEVSALAAISHTTTHFVGHTHQIIYITRQQLGDQYQFHWSPDSDRRNVPI